MELHYDALSRDRPEIRLITLPPGGSTDIQFRLWHATLHMPNEEASQRLSVKELNATLPTGWNAVETHQYKYSYLFEEDETEDTTWTHPDTTVDASLWGPALESPPVGFEPQFEALSYTWGSDEDPETAIVEYGGADDQRQSRVATLPIGRNLAEALRHLRRPGAYRTLWVDAICINQKDTPEREQQVKKMALLYKLAQRVVVWLGPQSDDSDLAMSTLEYLGSQLEISRNRYRFRAPGAIEPQWFLATCPLPYTEEVWRAVDNLLQRAWFSRLWIWQEIQLANSQAIVVCGTRETLWQNLRKAVISLFTKQNLPMVELRQRLGVIDLLTVERYSCSFSLLSNISRTLQCRDPRDKIYGMLSICGPRLASTIEVRYTETTANVYKSVFLDYTKQVGRLDLLVGCDSTLQLPGSPSWVPNWTVPRKTWSLYGLCLVSGISQAQVHYTAPDTLQVTGVQTVQIKTVSEQAPFDIAGVRRAMKEWEPISLRSATYVTGESLLDAYCATIRAGYFDERWPDLKAPTLAEWKEQYLNQVSVGHTTVTDEACGSDGDIDYMLKIVRGRTFFETEAGYIGVGPPEAKPGDIICILLGCKTPVVLRRRDDSQRYRVIGECYVRGFEDSVVLLGPLPSNTKVQMGKMASGYHATHTFLNIVTGLISDEDPRLETDHDWERIPHEWNADDPALYEYFRNRSTGEVINADPRLLPSALEKKGVPWRTFDLE